MGKKNIITKKAEQLASKVDVVFFVVLRHLVDQARAEVLYNVTRLSILQLEDLLDHRDLRRRRVETAEADPVVDDQSRADDVRTAVDRSSDQRHLQEARKFVLVLHAGLWMHQGAVITNYRVAPHQHVRRDGLAEDFNAEHVGNDLFRLPVNVGMDEGHVIVASDHIAQCRETLLDALNYDLIGKRVLDVHELLVCGCVGKKQSVLVANSKPADDTATCDCSPNDGDVVLEFALEDLEVI